MIRSRLGLTHLVERLGAERDRARAAAALWKRFAKRSHADHLYTSRLLVAAYKELVTYKDHHARSTKALAEMQVERDKFERNYLRMLEERDALRRELNCSQERAKEVESFIAELLAARSRIAELEEGNAHLRGEVQPLADALVKAKERIAGLEFSIERMDLKP